eukprot:TRINITY_DN12779_c0_g1_i1.p1 TRINITY_DN12779_c0_g1~~TRINITY_DN12779_c0_g1_i1.p1  ORF type:complete len:527 (-),score=154.12 TRINITY_DN12779_c0_g1_i1:114-1694(-)
MVAALRAAVLLGCTQLPAQVNAIEGGFLAARSSLFLQASDINAQDVDNDLVAELVKARQVADSVSSGAAPTDQASARLLKLEQDAQPLFTALPKNTYGKLSHKAVRYALHRLLSKEHRWYVKGLEPDGNSSTPLSSLSEWVPSHLQHLLEEGTHGQGLGVSELAALAATLEDAVHREAVGRLEALYRIHGYPVADPVNLTMADLLAESFFVVYEKGGNWTAKTSEEVWRRTRNFKRNMQHRWDSLTQWLHHVRHKVTNKEYGYEPFSFGELSEVVEEIGNQYGFHNDEAGCNAMRSSLLSMEDVKPGRVLLHDFYEKALTGGEARFAFTEKVDYLRTLGALDESDPTRPRVIVANYVGSRPQCLEASSIYAVCCPNICEPLLGKLEEQIGAPWTTPEVLLELVAKLPSESVDAPRELSPALKERLYDVSLAHGGRVPLHGRLVAQWMHHAFPHECPYPHETGSISPQAPDEWMQMNGQESVTASQDEMVCHVSGNCAGGKAALGDKAGEQVSAELPWSSKEELLEL